MKSSEKHKSQHGVFNSKKLIMKSKSLKNVFFLLWTL